MANLLYAFIGVMPEQQLGCVLRGEASVVTNDASLERSRATIRLR